MPAKPARRRPREEALIRWVDHHHFSGYVFSTMRGGKRYAKNFSAKRDGAAAALRRARRFRDWLLARLPPPTRLKRRYVAKPAAQIGVSLSRERSRQGTLVWRYVANWPVKGGGRAKASFSVAKYGKREARRLAFAARRKGVADFLAAVSFRDYQR